MKYTQADVQEAIDRIGNIMLMLEPNILEFEVGITDIFVLNIFGPQIVDIEDDVNGRYRIILDGFKRFNPDGSRKQIILNGDDNED